MQETDVKGVFEVQEGDDITGDQIKDFITELADKQRKRLDADHPEYLWWTDAVFCIRDIKTICTILGQNGDDAIADMLAEVTGKTVIALLMKLTNGDKDKVDEIVKAMQADSDMLTEILSSQVAQKFNGVKVQ